MPALKKSFGISIVGKVTMVGWRVKAGVWTMLARAKIRLGFAGYASGILEEPIGVSAIRASHFRSGWQKAQPMTIDANVRPSRDMWNTQDGKDDVMIQFEAQIEGEQGNDHRIQKGRGEQVFQFGTAKGHN